MYAAWKGHTEIVKLLLESGADPKRRNNMGQSAPELAAFNGQKITER